MKIFSWMAELRFRNPILYRVGLINLILTVILIVPLLFDERLVGGINTWIKPIKFTVSTWIYTWTFGWILFDLPKSKTFVKWITWTIGATMIVEIPLIIYQASRGVASHFNQATAFDGIIFGVMGLMIMLNTLAVIITAILFFVRKPNLDGAYLLALRMALVVFIIGNWIGGVVIHNVQHTVGVEDGGPGVPFTNWSTIGGDLRIAHFLGLHSIQIIPVVAFYFLKKTNLGLKTRRIISVIATLIFVAILSSIYFQAMRGESLFSNL